MDFTSALERSMAAARTPNAVENARMLATVAALLGHRAGGTSSLLNPQGASVGHAMDLMENHKKFLGLGDRPDHNTLVSENSLEAHFEDDHLVRGLVHLCVTLKHHNIVSQLS